MLPDEKSLVLPCPYCRKANRLPIARLAQTAKCGACHESVREAGESLKVTAAELEKLVAHSAVPVLVDFWASWCGPCRTMAPELDRVARSLRGELLVAKLNTDESPAAAAKYGARAIPLLVLFSGGHEVWRDTGARPAAQLERQLRQVMNRAA